MGLEAYNGKGSNGGVWEWTSTTFDSHDGLVPTEFFIGYSTDFFDTKHQVVVSILNSSIFHLLIFKTLSL
jgi:formylglycine-generating enzyme required for sulfatase activity